MNPRKTAYNRVYNRTTRGCLVMIVLVAVLVSAAGACLALVVG